MAAANDVWHNANETPKPYTYVAFLAMLGQTENLVVYYWTNVAECPSHVIRWCYIDDLIKFHEQQSETIKRLTDDLATACERSLGQAKTIGLLQQAVEFAKSQFNLVTHGHPEMQDAFADKINQILQGTEDETK